MDEGLDYESLARTLEESGNYRVLRKLEFRKQFQPSNGAQTRLGIVLDLETTGTDGAHDEIIEIAMLPFTYGLDGRVFEIHEAFQALRQPSQPISQEITRITGIDDTMVEGKVINPADVATFMAPAAVIIAHNAGFDRPFAERFSEAFNTKPWACSMSQVDWAMEGFEGTKLVYLAAQAGFFYDGHRAVNDCMATLELLAGPLPSTGEPALAQLLETARQATVRIWAENSPFELKDTLKRRGYRWNGDGGPAPRAWYVDVPEGVVETEMAFLRTEIYQREVELLTKRLTAYDRFSDRA